MAENRFFAPAQLGLAATLLDLGHTDEALERLQQLTRLATADDMAWLVFSEGLATQTSRAAVPGQPEIDYFWYGHPEAPSMRARPISPIARRSGGSSRRRTIEAP